MLNQIKIIFMDLDGTLLNNKHEISNSSIEMIKKLVRKGIYVFCSGRSTSDIIEKSKIAYASSIVVANNGSIVFDYEKNFKIYESAIDLNIIKDIWTFSLNNHIYITLNSAFKRYKTKGSSKQAFIIDTPEALEDTVAQIVVESPYAKNIMQLKDFIEKKYQNIEIKNIWEIPSVDSQVPIFEADISNKFNNKGNSVKKLLEYLHIEKKQAMSFGDQINDLEMFEACGTNIAMCNGNNMLKQKANFVTKYSNNQDGIAKFIEKLTNH